MIQEYLHKAARGKGFRGAAFLLTAAFIAYCGSFPLVTTDIWWHLTAAREMLARGAFLRTDPFSVTAYGYPWLNVHWLFQLVMYAVHGAGGIAALISARAVLFAGTWLLLFSIVTDRRTYWTGLVITAVTAFCVRDGMLMRPGLFTLLFIALFLLGLERFRTSGHFRWLWILVPVQVLWVNMQGLFLIGPVILVLVLAGEALAHSAAGWPLSYIRFRPQYERRGIGGIAVTLAGTLAACLVNPYGYRIYALPFKLFRVITPQAGNPFTAGVAENLPVWMTGAADAGDLLLRGLGLTFIVLTVVNRHRLVPFRLFLFATFLLLAVMADRNASLYAAVLIPLLIAELRSAALPVLRGVLRAAMPAAGLLLCSVLVFIVVQQRTTAPRAELTVPFRYPAGAVTYLTAHPVPGTVFNAARQGGYLLWHRYPEYRVFTDGRFTIRPGAFLRDYVALLDAPASFTAYFEKYGITHAVLPLDRRQRYAALAAELYRNPEWRMTYADGADAVFVRQDVVAAGEPIDGEQMRQRVELLFKDRALRKRAFDNLAALK